MSIKALMSCKQDTFCSYCGSKFSEQKLWPRTCYICNNESYKNPIPVVVTMIGVHRKNYPFSQCSWLIEQRGIDPGKNGWAFPSGFIEAGETWQQAAVRELQEEVGLTTEEKGFELYDVVNSASGNMLIFCSYKGLVYEKDIKFVPNHEVLAITFPFLPSHLELCFPTHNEMWNRYYDVR